MADRVAIVGAGLAGLSCALDLRAAGAEVVLLEAGGRPGGRVRTVRAPFPRGRHGESGAEWVDSHHERMLTLLDRYGLAVGGEGTRWTAVRRWVHVDGELLDADTANQRFDLARQVGRFEDALATYAADITDPADPLAHPHAAAMDSLSVADLADQLDLDPVARLLVDRNMQGEFASEAGRVSLLFVAQQRALHAQAERDAPVRAHRVVGGLDGLVSALAADAGDALRLGTAVIGVEQHEGGVVVRTPQGAFEADHAVLACSLVPLRSIEMTPALSPLLARAIAELDYGTVTKTALQYADRCWPPGYLTTDTGLQRVYEPTEDQPGTDGILMSYRGGDGARSWSASEADRIAATATALRSVHPCLGEVPEGGFSRAWHEHPRYGGSYAVYGPGQVSAFWSVLRQPCGRVWLAGEHAATVTGYMEGAVETGQRVAAAITAVG